MTPLAPGGTIGVIGGGQLGRMLAMAAARLGFRTVVLEPEADCPAAQVANTHIAAAYDDAEALERLAGLADVVTYEFENVPVGAAEALSRRVPVLPPPRALDVSQDRLAEKRFLNGLGIPTAPFHAVDSDTAIRARLAEWNGFGILKTRRLGYDGKGQMSFNDVDPDGIGEPFHEMGGVPLILEGVVAFQCEISVIAARGRDGALAAYDPPRNGHEKGILSTSTVPAGVSPAVAETARRHAFAILEALDYVGVIGVEFFVAGDRVIANEIAPRVHNSGHWTEAACAVSQFEQHIRAVAGLPLGSTRRHSNAVMRNLIGSEESQARNILGWEDAVLHFYGKAQARPGRKMGHWTKLSPLTEG